MNEIPAFGKAGSPFEYHLIGQIACDYPECLGDKVVFLDELVRQSGLRQVFSRRDYSFREVWMFVELHLACHPRAY